MPYPALPPTHYRGRFGCTHEPLGLVGNIYNMILKSFFRHEEGLG